MDEKKTVLVIDDDDRLIRLLEYNLKQAGFTALTAKDGQAGLRQFFEHKPNLIILDINMPTMDGWTVCQRVREVSEAPIIMLTAQAQSDDIIKGLDLGADDYVVKPFEVKELLARVRANLRRVAANAPVIHDSVTYSDAYLSINLAERRIIRDSEPVKLTKTEFNLLAELVRTAPRVATYRALLEKVWGFEYIDDVDYLRVYVWHLRRKIERDPNQPEYIANEQGVGYRFERQV